MVDANNAINSFNTANVTTSLFKIKEQITGQTDNNGSKIGQILVALKHLSNFWRTAEVP